MKKFVLAFCLIFLCSCGTVGVQPDASEAVVEVESQPDVSETATESDSDVLGVLIEFPGIPWGSTHEQAQAVIPDALSADDAYMVYPDGVFDSSPGVLDGGTILSSSADVLGYSAISVFWFVYDDTGDSFYLSRSQIVSDDSAAAYADVCAQLTEFYGPGVETVTDGWSVVASLDDDDDSVSTMEYPVYLTTWAGADSSFVSVQYTADDYTEYVFVAFGLQDAADTLDAMIAE